MNARVSALIAVIVLAVAAGVITARSDFDRNLERATDEGGAKLGRTNETFLDVPHVVFRNTSVGPDFGRIATVALDDPSGPRWFSDLDCERIDMVATGGSCLRASKGMVTKLEWLDLTPDLEVIDSTPLPGIGSRTRMSPDGDLTASTVFVNGHSYLSAGFSTRTQIRSSDSGDVDTGNLEGFKLSIDGDVVNAVDRNIWGVTFLDDNDTFYATAATGGQAWLVRGDISARTLTAVQKGAECPALSPDGSRIAYKVDVAPGREVRWVAAVLDLTSGEQRILDRGAQTFDDQIQWLDDDTVLYGQPREGQPGITDVWQLDVDTDKAPSVWLEAAWSPTIVH